MIDIFFLVKPASFCFQVQLDRKENQVPYSVNMKPVLLDLTIFATHSAFPSSASLRYSGENMLDRVRSSKLPNILANLFINGGAAPRKMRKVFFISPQDVAT